MKTLIAIGCVSILTAFSVGAQTKPNFTGKWLMIPGTNLPASSVRLGVGGLGEAFSVGQDAKTLTVIANLPPVGAVKSVYNLDGSSTSNPMTLGGYTVGRVSSVKWEAGTLVITTKVDAMGRVSTTTQTWSIDSAGHLLIKQTSDSDGRVETTQATYAKS